MTKKKLASALSSSLLLIACDGIGRPIVGERPHFGGASMCASPLLSCESVLGNAAPLAPLPDAPFGLESCGGTDAMCALPNDLWGNPHPELRGCALSLPIRDGDTTGVPTRQDCMRVTLQILPPAQSLRLANLTLEQSELTLVSEQPLTVDIASSKLRRSRIQLRGPITLRILEQSSLQEVRVTRDTLVPASAASASLEVFESDARGLIAENLGGHIELVRSLVSSTQLYAPEVTLESLHVAGLAIAADILHAVQVQGGDVRLQIGRGTLSKWEVQRLQLEKCKDVLLAGSSVYESTFASCAGTLRVDGTQVDTSLVAGAVESNQTTWVGNALGVGAGPTSLELWGGALLTNRLCPSLARLTLGTVETVLCNSCDQLTGPPEARLCPAIEPYEPDLPTTYDNPFCPALDLVQTFPACDPPVRNENPS